MENQKTYRIFPHQSREHFTFTSEFKELQSHIPLFSLGEVGLWRKMWGYILSHREFRKKQNFTHLQHHSHPKNVEFQEQLPPGNAFLESPWLSCDSNFWDLGFPAAGSETISKNPSFFQASHPPFPNVRFPWVFFFSPFSFFCPLSLIVINELPSAFERREKTTMESSPLPFYPCSPLSAFGSILTLELFSGILSLGIILWKLQVVIASFHFPIHEASE